MEKKIVIRENKQSEDDWALMISFDTVAASVVKGMIIKWTPIALTLGNAIAGIEKKKALFGTICIFVGRVIGRNKELLMTLDQSLSQEEYRYLVAKVVDIFEIDYQNNQYQLMLTCMGTPDVGAFFDSAFEYFDEILKPNKQYGMLPLCYSRYKPVIPQFGEKDVMLPPLLRDSPDFIVLIKTVDNVSFFFDTLQAPHMMDLSILVDGGMSYNLMRKVNKKPESRYGYTKMSEFVENVFGDLMKAFKMYSYKVDKEGKLINFNIQGEKIGNTLMEISAMLLYGHYYVTLHCYPAKE